MLKYHALKFLRENKRQSIYVLQMALEEDKRKGVSKPRKSQGFKKKKSERELTWGGHVYQSD